MQHRNFVGNFKILSVGFTSKVRCIGEVGHWLSVPLIIRPVEEAMKIRPIIPDKWSGPTSQPVQFPNLQDGIDRLCDNANSGTAASQSQGKGKKRSESK
jgi:hypothetical protein